MQPVKKRKRKRGPKPKTLVYRLRALVWYAAVKSVDDLSDKELDSRFVKRSASGRSRRKIGRTRTFSLIATRGVDPNWSEQNRKARRPHDPMAGGNKPRRRRSFSLVEVVGKQRGYEHTKRVYFSLFWRLIVPPAPRLSELQSVITSLLDDLGLFRAIGEAPLESGPDIKNHDAFKRFPSKVFDRSLNELAAAGSLDHVALLAAMYLEALYVGALEQAKKLRKALRTCAVGFVKRAALPALPQLLLLFLLEERVIQNQWEDLISQRDRVYARKVLLEGRPESVWPKKTTRFMLDVIALLLYRYRNIAHEFPVVQRQGAIAELRKGSSALWDINKEYRKDFWVRSMYEPHRVLDKPSRFAVARDFFNPPDRRRKKARSAESII